MHKWILSWILPTLLYRSYFYVIFLVSAISFACNDMTPEQMATNVNCSTPERHTRSYDYMEGGNVRVRRLFCRTQWYIKIDRRGKIKGVLERNSNYSILEIRTVAVGIVAIKGVASEYFLAMNKSGKLYGKKVCNEDCNFIELIEENHYNTYASANWTHKGKEMYIALKQNGAPKRGQRTNCLSTVIDQNQKINITIMAFLKHFNSQISINFNQLQPRSTGDIRKTSPLYKR